MITSNISSYNTSFIFNIADKGGAVA